MSYRFLIVEDEIIVATEIEYVISELGHEPIGIASTLKGALALAERTDIALVDLNLCDGPTGMTIGRELAEKFGVTVVFMTANPAQLGDGVPGTIGVVAKPVTDEDLREVVEFAVARRATTKAKLPRRLRLFGGDGISLPG